MKTLAAFVRRCPVLTAIALNCVLVALAVATACCATSPLTKDCRQYGCPSAQECRSAASVHECMPRWTDG